MAENENNTTGAHFFSSEGTSASGAGEAQSKPVQPSQVPVEQPLYRYSTPAAPQQVPTAQPDSVPATQVTRPVTPSAAPTPTQQIPTPTASTTQTASITTPPSAYTAPTQAQAVRQAVSASQAQTNRPAPDVRVVKQRKGLGAFGAFMCALLGGLIGAGLLFGALWFTGHLNLGRTTTTSSGTSHSQAITINPSNTDATVAQAVAAKALPSVVSLHVITTANEEGLGSGVILDTDGNIITNYHVIEGARSISVNIGNKAYEGEVVGNDASSDLAVVHVDLDGDEVTPIEIGDSDELVVGDWVMTIGSPYGLDQSCSTGIVSSLYRSTMLSDTSGNTIYANLIQTDAAINPGNSGGALVDEEGKLVGINSLNASYSGSSSGVGFAIPANYAISAANSIIAGEPVLHAYIGLNLSSANVQGLWGGESEVMLGAYVARVTADSPADEAGIREGDVITSLDGEQITSADALILAVRSHKIGETVPVTLMRDGKEIEVTVTLGSDEALQNTQDESEDNREELGSFDPFGGNNRR